MTQSPEQILTFSDAESRRVAGILATPEEKPDRLVVLCHGFLSNKNSSTNKALTAMLVPKGIATLRFDFLGQGESEGPFERITIGAAVGQALAALHLAESKGYHRLGLVGSSFGGLVGLLAAAQYGKLRCLALKCPVSDFGEMLRTEFGPKGMAEWQSTNTIPNVAGGAGRIRLPYSFYEDSAQHIAYPVAGTINVPTVIVHGDADEYVPVAQSLRLRDSLGGPCSLVILSGANHHFSHPPHFQDMVACIGQWMIEHLR